MKPVENWPLIASGCVFAVFGLISLMLCLTDLINSIRGKRDDDEDDKPRRRKEEPVEDDDRPVKKARRVEDE